MDKNNTYLGFYIKDNKYKSVIDKFFSSLSYDENECYVLKNFWKKYCPRIDLPYMNLDTRQELLISLIDNPELWNNFNKLINNDIKPNEEILALPEVQEQLLKGERIIYRKIYDMEIGIDLRPLNEYSYWIKLINNLFISVIREIIDQIKETETKLERSILLKRLITINIQCLPLIKNKYAYNDISYFNIQVEKIISFLDDGLEFALYSLGIMFPDVVCDNIHPVINTSSNLYNHPDLAISFDDPVFGIAKKQFFQYY